MQLKFHNIYFQKRKKMVLHFTQFFLLKILFSFQLISLFQLILFYFTPINIIHLIIIIFKLCSKLIYPNIIQNSILLNLNQLDFAFQKNNYVVNNTYASSLPIKLLYLKLFLYLYLLLYIIINLAIIIHNFLVVFLFILPKYHQRTKSLLILGQKVLIIINYLPYLFFIYFIQQIN